MLDTMRKDEERLTPYSVELGVTVKRDSHHVREDYTRVQKHGTWLYKHYRQLLVSEYTFGSRLDRPMTAYVDHRFRYKVREDTIEPVEVTDNFWRFKLELAAKKNTELVVKEVSEQYETIEITGIARTAIHQMVKEELISEEVRLALEKVADVAEKIARIEEQIAKKESSADDIEEGQARLRENLKALGTSSEEARLRQKYVSKLTKEEERIETLRREVAELKELVEAERERLNDLVDALALR